MKLYLKQILILKNKQKFIPNVYFDISKYMNSKLKLLEIYKTEIKKHPFQGVREQLNL